MSVKLSPQQHDQIFAVLRRSFSDFALFDSLVSEKLRQALIDSNSIEINEKTTKRVVERYFAVDAFKTAEQKALIYPLELIFQSCYVLIIAHRPSSIACQWKDVNTLLTEYPQFARDVDPEELQYLLNYRNVLKIALTIIPARLNKGRLLQIGGKLEGSNREYITGSGQKIEVVRRTQIYHHESDVKLVVKKARLPKILSTTIPVSQSPCHPSSDDDSHVSQGTGTFACVEKRKRKRSNVVTTCTSSSFSHTKLKMMKLHVDEIAVLKGDEGGDGNTVYVEPPQQLQKRCAPMLTLPQHCPSAFVSTHNMSNYGNGLSLQSLVDLPTPYGSNVSHLDPATVRITDSYFGCGNTPYNQFDQFESSPLAAASQEFYPVSPPPYLMRETTYDMIMNSGLLSNASAMWGGDLAVISSDECLLQEKCQGQHFFGNPVSISVSPTLPTDQPSVPHCNPSTVCMPAPSELLRSTSLGDDDAVLFSEFLNDDEFF